MSEPALRRAPEFRAPRAAFRLLLFILQQMTILVAFALSRGPLARFYRATQLAWSRVCLFVCGLRLRRIGQAPTGDTPVLYVANHLSYLDIPVLYSLIEGSFIAKAEVARWPFFGHAAKLARTIFVERSGPRAATQKQELLDRMAKGEDLILFPEGTSTDGSGVVPFKSTLFSITEGLPEGRRMLIQPVALAYPRDRQGRWLDGERREYYCWFGDSTLVRHLWRALGLPGAEVEVRFGKPIAVVAGASRKHLAHAAWLRVAAMVAEANEGSRDGKPAPGMVRSEATSETARVLL